MAAPESAITIRVRESSSDVHLTIWRKNLRTGRASDRSVLVGKPAEVLRVRMFALTASAEADSSGRWTTYVGGPSH